MDCGTETNFQYRSSTIQSVRQQQQQQRSKSTTIENVINEMNEICILIECHSLLLAIFSFVFLFPECMQSKGIFNRFTIGKCSVGHSLLVGYELRTIYQMR